MKIKFLGTADSAGIPVHNCTCKVCTYYREKKKKNLSTCAYIQINDEYILLDAGIDDISNIFDGKKLRNIFLTHFHADHCLALLRLRHSKEKINCYHPKDEIGFSDLLKHKHSISYQEVDILEKKIINNISFTPIPLIHSKNTFGYLIEYENIKIAYLTDCSGIKNKYLDFLKEKSLDVAFLDACYDERKSQGNHLNYIQATDILDKLKVKKGYLMHISHTTKEYILKNNIKLNYSYIDENAEFVF
jgi:phosphoribosyl 1,2-cyclic phosphate phosphodiesterase